MSSPSERGAGKPLDPKKLLREAIAGGDADFASSGWQPPPVERLGELFPELDVVELIGRGGMGAVYRVVQRKLDRTVALKVLPPELAKEPSFEERFLREARALAGLKHARILTVHDFGEREGLYYLVTEFVEGMNLRQLMDMGELSPDEALRVTPQICEALQFAHDHGVVHRDIKPENLLIDLSGEVRIADFGLARIVGENASGPALTRSSQVLGTPQYMAPEQWRDGQNVDHRADIYAVGVVLYEMLTGQLPIGHFDLPSRRKGVPKGLDAIVQRSLAQRPEERYQQASDVSSELLRCRSATPKDAPSGRRESSSPAAATDRQVVLGRVPRALIVAWITVVLAFIATGGVVGYMKTLAMENMTSEVAHATQLEEAHQWARQHTALVESGEILDAYFENALVPEWRARRAEAATSGVLFSEPMPQIVQDPPPTRTIAMVSTLMFGVAALGLLVPICGFSSIATLKRRRHRAGLGLAVFTAWILPIAIVIGLTITIISENIRDNDTAVVASAIAGILLGIAGVVWMTLQFRRLSELLAVSNER